MSEAEQCLRTCVCDHQSLSLALLFIHYLQFSNQVFFFNLTNEADLLEGRAGPRVEKIGPYTYTQKIHRVSSISRLKTNQHPFCFRLSQYSAAQESR